MPVATNLVLYHGQSVTYSFTPASTVSTAGKDLTGKTLKFQLKADQRRASTVVLAVDPTVTDATNGLYTVSLTSANTQQTPQLYYWEVVVSTAGSEDVLANGQLDLRDHVYDFAA